MALLPDLDRLTLAELRLFAAALRLAIGVLESAGAAARDEVGLYVEADSQAVTVSVTVPLAEAPAGGAA